MSYISILGHFLLTELLLPKLERSPDGGRVVNVSSKVHLKADSVDPEIIASKQHYSRFKMGGMTYARSKLAQVWPEVVFHVNRLSLRDPSEGVKHAEEARGSEK